MENNANTIQRSGKLIRMKDTEAMDGVEVLISELTDRELLRVIHHKRKLNEEILELDKKFDECQRINKRLLKKVAANKKVWNNVEMEQRSKQVQQRDLDPVVRYAKRKKLSNANDQPDNWLTNTSINLDQFTVKTLAEFIVPFAREPRKRRSSGQRFEWDDVHETSETP